MNFKYMVQPKNTIRVDELDDGDDSINLPLLGAKKKPYQQYETTFTAQHIHFYLSEEIGEPSQYTDMIHKINSASQSDIISIHLNTPGGMLITGVQIINAMQNSQAKIITILESTAYSLGTLIFLAGDELIVQENSLMMFHNWSGGMAGKGHEQAAELDATIKWFTNMAKKIYIPFLSEDELDRIIKGEDIWLQSSDIRRRLDKMLKQLKDDATTPKVKKPRTKKVDTTV